MKQIDSILEKVNTIFREVLDDDKLNISHVTTADDVDDWDSLSHIQLIVAIEKKFKLRFTSGEIENYKNVGEMCFGILNKKGNQ